MPISDLTGYTWTANANPDVSFGYAWTVNFMSDNNSYSGITITMEPFPQPHYVMLYDNEYAYSYNGQTGTWGNEAFKIVQFTGGADATSADLIAWLEANGTLIPSTPQLTVDMSTLNGWDALSSGTHSVQIVAKATGYRDSDPSTAVQFTKAASGYNLTIDFVPRNYRGLGESYLYIKLNGSNDEYSFNTPWAGGYGYFRDPDANILVDVQYALGGAYTFSNVTQVEYSGSVDESDFIGVNSDTTPVSLMPTTIALTGDTTITVYYDYDE